MKTFRQFNRIDEYQNTDQNDEIKDGIYSVENVKYLVYDYPDWDIETSDDTDLPEEVIKFFEANPKWCWAQLRKDEDIPVIFIFSNKPTKIKKLVKGKIGRGITVIDDILIVKRSS